MANPDEHGSDGGKGTPPDPSRAIRSEVRPDNPPAVRDVPGERPPAAEHPAGSLPARPPRKLRTWLIRGSILLLVGIGAYYLIPWIILALNTISTDDAYVNGHVTYLAPRVAGQVAKVYVDDNYRVQRGDILVQLDKEPYRIQLEISRAAVDVANTNLIAARAQVYGQVAGARANRFRLEHSIEDVDNQIANLRAAVATLNSKKASLELGQANLKRGEELAPTGGISKEDLDVRRQTVKVEQAAVEQALQSVYAIRVALGLPEKPAEGHELTEVPPDLDQNFSTVRQALGDLLQTAAQFGYFPTSWDATPKQAIADFYKQSPKGNLDQIYSKLIPEAPAIKQAEAKLLQTRRDLAQAELNLLYCDVVSDIDGVVTRRNVNPGNYVQVGQSLMAVRSITEIWVDANFKETQLADLRIGQRVRCEIDMYGSRQTFWGHISGFTMGTGTTLALLPPENATGNFVKIVQRLPVRIEFDDYKPDKVPIFVGLSVEPYVYYKENAQGERAGEVLQPPAALPKGQVDPTVPEPDVPSEVPAAPRPPSGDGNTAGSDEPGKMVPPAASGREKSGRGPP
jgi:membrane fusion protein, multidrug efflux system